MWAAALRIDIRLPGCQSLKDKRAVLRPHKERLRKMVSISLAEVGAHDAWQRSLWGAAVVASDRAGLEAVIEVVSRYLGSQPDLEVVDFRVSYLEEPDA